MPLRFDLVTFDTTSTDALADFWKAALDLVEVEREDGDRWIVLASADGIRRLGFQRGEARGGSAHLDLRCAPDEFDAECARLLALGATPARPPRREPYGSIANLVDPAGYLFDLCAYEPQGRV